MKGIIMNTKKIYITPEINVMNIMTTYIMAGSNGGSASSGIGTDSTEDITVSPSPGTGGSGSSGSSDVPVVQAKNNSFNAWETWEEY